jgi:glutathione synthase/RimK-type ligase-like ATP-grasp enzyme
MIGKPGSQAYRTIREETGLLRFVSNIPKPVDIIVNYGLNGARLDGFLRTHKAARNIPIINKYIGVSKYSAIQKVSGAGMLVPESKLSLSRADNKNDWIEKRFNSSRGYGICMAYGRERMRDKYYQRFIRNRIYELRVAAFLWVPKSEWRIFKRLGDSSKIAWNFHQGGHFTYVRDKSTQTFRRAIDMSEKVLKVMNMGFGAVDFLVDDSYKVYFIEVNSAPGFTEFSGSTYIHAFQKLLDTPIKKLKSIANE